MSIKKTLSLDKAFFISGKGYQSKPGYYFLDFVTLFNIRETAKLTVAPITAKIIVFAISSERILGKTLNKVPDAVAGGVISAVSRITVDDKAKSEEGNPKKPRDGG